MNFAWARNISYYTLRVILDGKNENENDDYFQLKGGRNR